MKVSNYLKVSDITSILEAWAPCPLQEGYDNAGLMVGDPEMEVRGVLVNLDITEAVVDEAIQRGCNLVVGHHPIWFMPRKRLNGEDYISRTIIKAIKNDVALYAIHTNLDNVSTGVNAMMAQKLGLINTRTLRPMAKTLGKLVTYVPAPDLKKVSEALFAAGAGKIGNYDECSFVSEGKGTFRPMEGANPTIGHTGKRENVAESRIEIVFPIHQQHKIVAALKMAHPYEEVAYQVFSTENAINDIGAGLIGQLPVALKKDDFLTLVKKTFGCGAIRYSDAQIENVSQIALCGGAGSFLTGDALKSKVDAFITGDISYHKFFDNENRMMLLDIGHYESEQYTSSLICSYLSEKIPNFAVLLSEVRTNPVKYY